MAITKAIAPSICLFSPNHCLNTDMFRLVDSENRCPNDRHKASAELTAFMNRDIDSAKCTGNRAFMSDGILHLDGRGITIRVLVIQNVGDGACVVIVSSPAQSRQIASHSPCFTRKCAPVACGTSSNSWPCRGRRCQGSCLNNPRERCLVAR